MIQNNLLSLPTHLTDNSSQIYDLFHCDILNLSKLIVLLEIQVNYRLSKSSHYKLVF